MDRPTTTITTTTIQTTTIGPVVTNCAATAKIISATGGYIKSLCIMSVALNNDQASQNCIASRMQLFNINSDEVQKSFNHEMVTIFGLGTFSTLWVNGKLGNDGNWYTFTPNSAPLYSNIAWEEGSPAMVGGCLMTTNLLGPFSIADVDCAEAMWSVCDYVAP